MGHEVSVLRKTWERRKFLVCPGGTSAVARGCKGTGCEVPCPLHQLPPPLPVSHKHSTGSAKMVPRHSARSYPDSPVTQTRVCLCACMKHHAAGHAQRQSCPTVETAVLSPATRPGPGCASFSDVFPVVLWWPRKPCAQRCDQSTQGPGAAAGHVDTWCGGGGGHCPWE